MPETIPVKFNAQYEGTIQTDTGASPSPWRLKWVVCPTMFVPFKISSWEVGTPSSTGTLSTASLRLVLGATNEQEILDSSGKFVVRAEFGNQGAIDFRRVDLVVTKT